VPAKLALSSVLLRIRMASIAEHRDWPRVMPVVLQACFWNEMLRVAAVFYAAPMMQIEAIRHGADQ